jgi:hypothetical protein
MVMRIFIGQEHLYEIQIWDDGRPMTYNAYEWEMVLVEKSKIPQQ